MRTVLMLSLILSALMSSNAFAAQKTSLISPIVLQGCAEKVDAARSNFWAGRSVFSKGYSAAGNSKGEQTVGFDLSFVNTTNKTADVVLIRVGGTDFAKTGTFSPGVVIAWRIAAKSGGECIVRAVRFQDGTEWDTPDVR